MGCVLGFSIVSITRDAAIDAAAAAAAASAVGAAICSSLWLKGTFGGFIHSGLITAIVSDPSTQFTPWRPLLSGQGILA